MELSKISFVHKLMYSILVYTFQEIYYIE